MDHPLRTTAELLLGCGVSDVYDIIDFQHPDDHRGHKGELRTKRGPVPIHNWRRLAFGGNFNSRDPLLVFSGAVWTYCRLKIKRYQAILLTLSRRAIRCVIDTVDSEQSMKHHQEWISHFNVRWTGYTEVAPTTIESLCAPPMDLVSPTP